MGEGPHSRDHLTKKKITFTMVPVQEMQAQMLPDFLQSLQQRFLNTRRPSTTLLTDNNLPQDDAKPNKDHHSARTLHENPSLPNDRAPSDYPHGGLGTPLKGLKNYQWNQKRYAAL